MFSLIKIQVWPVPDIEQVINNKAHSVYLGFFTDHFYVELTAFRSRLGANIRLIVLLLEYNDTFYT